MNKYEETILNEIKKNGPINVKGLRRIVCDDSKYPNRIGTPTLEKYLKRLHIDGYITFREIKNQKLYSIIKASGFNYEKFIETVISTYNKAEKTIKDVLKYVENDTYDKKLHIYYNVIDLLLAHKNFLKIANLMSKNKLTSNSYIEIERKLEKLLLNTINGLERNTTPLVFKNFERNLREPGIQIEEYLELRLKKKPFSK